MIVPQAPELPGGEPAAVAPEVADRGGESATRALSAWPREEARLPPPASGTTPSRS